MLTILSPLSNIRKDGFHMMIWEGKRSFTLWHLRITKPINSAMSHISKLCLPMKALELAELKTFFWDLATSDLHNFRSFSNWTVLFLSGNKHGDNFTPVYTQEAHYNHQEDNNNTNASLEPADVNYRHGEKFTSPLHILAAHDNHQVNLYPSLRLFLY